MKARHSQITKKKELYESAKARLMFRDEVRAENELKRTVESMKLVYPTSKKDKKLMGIRNNIWSNLPNNNSSSSMNSYSRNSLGAFNHNQS